MSDLEVDRKRAMAIGAMEAMAADFREKGDLDSAAGCYDEAARLIDAHAETASDDAAAAKLREQALDYRERGRQLRTGESSGGSGGGGGSNLDAAWEVTWTQAGGLGQPTSAPGAGWEPFSLAFSPSDPTAPIIGWRRPTG